MLPILHDIGFEILSPVEPECNNVFALKEQWQNRMAFIGGVPTSLLAYGNWDKIETAVKEYCQKLGPGGGFVLGAAGPVIDEIPPQNYTAMIEAIHRYGAYETVDPAPPPTR